MYQSALRYGSFVVKAYSCLDIVNFILSNLIRVSKYIIRIILKLTLWFTMTIIKLFNPIFWIILFTMSVLIYIYFSAVWRRQWHPTPELFLGKSHGQRSLVAAVHGVARSWTRLSDFTFTFHFHALEKEMAPHSSVLAWRIPGTGEPGGLPSLGSHRVGHDWSDLAAAAAVLCIPFHNLPSEEVTCLVTNPPNFCWIQKWLFSRRTVWSSHSQLKRREEQSQHPNYVWHYGES